MFGIGGFEIILIFLVILLLFGAKQLPEFARTLGKTWRTIRHTTEDIKREFETQVNNLEEKEEDTTTQSHNEN